MLIIGWDYHPGFQQIACVNSETGECGEQQLEHCAGETEKFYRDLKLRGVQVRLGMEATGHGRWFERLLAEPNYELWMGDPAQIKACRVRKQKTDRRDADHILKLMMEDRFPRVWAPSPENRDLRQLLWHRHRLVQMRTRVMNQLQAIAMNEGVGRKKGLWSKSGREQLESLALAPWAQRRRQDVLELLDRLNPRIKELSAAIEQEAGRRPELRLLMTHPGVGPITALAFWLILGPADRFRCGKQVSSYLGLVPCEYSSADRQRLGHISKQGNTLLRLLLVEAAHATVRCDRAWRGRFLHLVMRRARAIALVAMARKLAVGLYWMLRQRTERQPTPVSVRTWGSSRLGQGVK
jgi:transposase